ICGRKRADIDSALSEISAGGGAIDGIAGDIARLADVEGIVHGAVQRFGTIDVLVNNASVLGPRAAIADYPIDTWREVIDINLNGLFFMTHEVLPIMLAKRRGSIVNLTSGVGRVGKARWGAYAVSKAGLEGFSQVLADELKDSGIRVNSVNPAATRTQMRAMAYPAEDPATLPSAEDVVPIFLYLASDDSNAITGQSLNARDWPKPGD
ncbi:MAG TPA: SDR family NAD(P)-dependent oxidoreductase, partial [Candidatus Binatus sp.]|nr:SDR family NAD(P)-dependent oxidoreductase [Candidatus Binatus sp.]